MVEQGIKGEQSAQRVAEQGLSAFIDVETLFDFWLYLMVDEVEECISSSSLWYIEVDWDQIVRCRRREVEISQADDFFLIVSRVADAHKYSLQGRVFCHELCCNRQHAIAVDHVYDRIATFGCSLCGAAVNIR